MSLGGAKSQLQAALQSITWSAPSSAALILPALPSSFARVDTQQFAGEEAAVVDWPYARIHVPDLDERRETAGSDVSSYKKQLFPALIWIYIAGLPKDWQGLGDYRDVVLDATLAYFRGNSSPQPGIVSPGNNDHIVAWGLHQRARTELPDLITTDEGEALVLRSTVAIDLYMTIV